VLVPGPGLARFPVGRSRDQVKDSDGQLLAARQNRGRHCISRHVLAAKSRNVRGWICSFCAASTQNPSKFTITLIELSSSYLGATPQRSTWWSTSAGRLVPTSIAGRAGRA
jgi:hypothetical protein